MLCFKFVLYVTFQQFKRGMHKFSKKLRATSKFWVSKGVAWSKFHVEDPQAQGTNVENLIDLVTWRPGFVQPWLETLLVRGSSSSSSKVKLSRYRPPQQAFGDPVGQGSGFSRRSALWRCKVVTLTHRPSLPPGVFLVLIFRGWVDPRAHGSVGSYGKNPHRHHWGSIPRPSDYRSSALTTTLPQAPVVVNLSEGFAVIYGVLFVQVFHVIKAFSLRMCWKHDRCQVFQHRTFLMWLTSLCP
jgi:hypothetical protein